MRSAKRFLLGLILIAGVAQFALGQTPDSTGSQSKSEPTPELSYQLVRFLPSYRFVSPSGFAGRVGEYDSLFQSVGGDVALTFLDYTQHNSLKYHGSFISRDEYDMDTQFRLGKYLTLSLNNRSFVRHLDDVPFGTNLDPDAAIRTSMIPENALFGVKRTMNTVNARLKVPKTPLTVFVKGGWQARRGLSQLQFFDMGNITNPPILPPDPESCDGSCHSTSRYRQVNYTNRNLGGGVEMKVAHVVLTYEHDYRSFNDRLQNPVDFFGTAASVTGETLPPLGPGVNSPLVPDTLQGFYQHNILSRHDSQIDMVRAHAPITSTLTFNASASYGRTTNLLTNNPQNSFNADATLNWNPLKKLHATLDYHQQNLLNDFIPSLYIYFGNPSLHRHWTGARVEYNLSSMFDVEAHYQRTGITRSNSDLWPQPFYSPSSFGLIGTPADAFVPRLVASTFSNTLGFTVKFHRTQTWNLRSGYEWIGTHDPGYLTDPQTSQRLFAGGSLTPKPWVSFSEDFSVLRQSDFKLIQRSNRLYLNTAYVTLRPVTEFTLGLGYAYYHNNLKSDLVYGTDPFYTEALAPFKAISRSYSISSTYLFKKKLGWNVELAHVNSTSSLRPNLALAPLCDAGTVQPCSVSTAFAADFSTVAVPQYLASSALDYHWGEGFDSGIRFQYGSYSDQVHPELDGHLNSYSLFFGKIW